MSHWLSRLLLLGVLMCGSLLLMMLSSLLFAGRTGIRLVADVVVVAGHIGMRLACCRCCWAYWYADRC